MIVGLLSFFDEKPAWLAELVASMSRAGLSHVVAVDGAYAAYPQARGASGAEVVEAITHTAHGAGIGVTVHVPRWPWAENEVEKRSFMFQMATAVAEPGTDWLWVCDGDELIVLGAGIASSLAAVEEDVAEVLLAERVADGSDEWSMHPVRRLFRAQNGPISVQGRHYRYVTPDGRVLWGDDGEMEPAAQLWDTRMRHRPEARASYRTGRRREYYVRRDTLNLEGGPSSSPASVS